jgi:hypothetical protein
MTSYRQLGLFPERGDQRGAALHGFESASGEVADLVNAGGAQVGHLAGLEIAPDIFDRIEFGRIGGKVVQDDVIAPWIRRTRAPDGYCGP